ncbi:MAG: Thiol-disulfide oxidoreductase ResA [Phycisphaerae bacterium]|nr:Thiol-disulfide oxidoreductase ResA [Phycisphaerae bacterium]
MKRYAWLLSVMGVLAVGLWLSAAAWAGDGDCPGGSCGDDTVSAIGDDGPPPCCQDNDAAATDPTAVAADVKTDAEAKLADKAKEAAKPAPALTVARLGQPAPNFLLVDQAGQPHRLSDYRGKTVVLEWVNWGCPFIQRHLAAGTAQALVEKYKDKNVVWLAINSTRNSTAAENKATADKFKLNYAVLDDHRGRVGRMFAARHTPDVRIIDAKGVLAYTGGLDNDPKGDMSDRVNYVDLALTALTGGQSVAVPETKAYGCGVHYQPVGQFTLADQAGKSVSLTDYAGKVVVLEWTNWDCPFVQAHLRAETTSKLAAKYAGQGVVWLMVNSTNYATADANKAAVEKFHLPTVLDDHAGEVGRLYGARTTPDVFVLDANGAIAYEGAIDDNPMGRKDKSTNYVAQALDELLGDKGVSVKETRPYGCSVKYAKKTASVPVGQ